MKKIYLLPIIVFIAGATLLWFKSPNVKATATAPELPRSYIDTTMPASASTCTVTLNTGDNIQTAINNAALGDTICLTAGSTYNVHLTLPNKTTGSGWITIRSTGLSNLPAGYRVSPSSTSSMAQLVTTSSDPIIATDDTAHHYRISGLEFYADPSSITYDPIQIGGLSTTTPLLPHDITVDRSYIHCAPTKNCKHGMTMNGTNIAIVDSYIEEIHVSGQEVQAISFYNTNGPIKIVNNYLSAAGMSVLVGGATPFITDAVPADIEISRNYMYKPLKWFDQEPTWDGSNWDIKNHFELKFAERVLFEKNILENVWADAQIGWAIIFNCFDSASNGPSWCRIDDITIRDNVIKKAGYGIDMRAKDTLSNVHIHRVAVENNIWLDVNTYYAQYVGGGHFAALLYGPEDINFNHNTVLQSGNIISFDTFYYNPPDLATNFQFTNNIVQHNNYGIITDNTGLVGTPSIATSTTNYLVNGNAIINIPGGISYPAGNFSPATTSDIGFTNLAGGISDIRNYALTATSTYHNAATDGTDVGANITTLYAATNGVEQGTPENSTSSASVTPRIKAVGGSLKIKGGNVYIK